MLMELIKWGVCAVSRGMSVPHHGGVCAVSLECLWQIKWHVCIVPWGMHVLYHYNVCGVSLEYQCRRGNVSAVSLAYLCRIKISRECMYRINGLSLPYQVACLCGIQ